MGKKVLALLLTAAMLITGLTFGASAAAFEVVDNVAYTPVTNQEELAAALAAGGNILLKNDIELGSKFKNYVDIKAGTVLNGNGYAIVQNTTRVAVMFRFAAGTKVGEDSVTIKNISFGKKDAPIKMTGPNALFVGAADQTSLVNFEDVDFYVQKNRVNGNSAALFVSANQILNFFDCSLDVNMTDISSGSLHGGWIAEVHMGEITMNNCVTTGTIKGASGTGAFVAQMNTEGRLRMTNCINLASVTGSNFAGGFLGNIGLGADHLYFTDCINYGAVTSTATNYNGMAGGFVGRMSNKSDQGAQRTHAFYNCVNYGPVKSGSAAGGFVGRSHDHDSSAKIYFTFGECFNLGNITGDSYAGGIIGVGSPVIYRADLINCANVGLITSSKGYAGNFAGLLSAGVVEGGWAAGVVAGSKKEVLIGQSSGTYKGQAGSVTNQVIEFQPNTVSNVTYVGTLTKIPEGVTKAEASAVLAAMGEQYGIALIEADSDDKTAVIIAAAPELRGVQKGAEADGKVALRFAAVLDGIKAYKAGGFEITVTTAEGSTTKTYYGHALSKTLNANGTTVAASAYGATYFFTAAVENIPTDGRVLISVVPFAIGVDGTTTYTGKGRLLEVNNGAITREVLMINGISLDQFAVVYANNPTKNEKLLAERLADQIRKLTGVTMPVGQASRAHTRAAELVVGKTNRTPTLPEGRSIVPFSSKPGSIAMNGDNTAQLSEAVTYFLDMIKDALAKGESMITVEENIAVPADTKVTMMAYNMGAKDNANIKKYEWDLIVDYLPDVWTSQEPWAGFLDDFCNNYAVQPDIKFEQSSADDDVMKSNVNNKSFTGNGYYGIYWGLPRWVPGDPCTAGKASYSVIFYAKDRFTVNESRSGTFWLSERPDVSGTNISGSNFARCATYATLTDKNTGESFVVVNVHLDFVAAVQSKQIEVMLTQLQKRVDTGLPVIIMGDMNSEAHSSPINYYKTNKIMPMTALDEIATEAYRDDRNIDWFFVNKPERVDVTYYNYCGEQTFLNSYWNSSMELGMPSDHPAIYTEFYFKK